jgi:hypothetical protein
MESSCGKVSELRLKKVPSDGTAKRNWHSVTAGKAGQMHLATLADRESARD